MSYIPPTNPISLSAICIYPEKEIGTFLTCNYCATIYAYDNRVGSLKCESCGAPLSMVESYETCMRKKGMIQTISSNDFAPRWIYPKGTNNTGPC